MDNKNRDDITKSLERTKLAKNYSIEKGFDYLDKTAKKVSNLKTDLLDENDEKNNDIDNKENESSNESKEYNTRLKTSENSSDDKTDANDVSTTKLKTGVNNQNITENSKSEDNTENVVSKSKLKTGITKVINKTFKFNDNQGKISKSITVVSKTGKGITKVGSSITKASRDLDKAMSSDGTGKDFLKTRATRNTKKVIKKKIVNPVKKPIKKAVNKATTPLKRKIASAFKILLKKVLKLLIAGVSAISEFILPLALVILIIVAVCSIFSWGTETRNNYETYMESIQESYDKEVEQFLRDNPTGIVVGVRGGYGKINWRVPFAIMQGLGADIKFDNSEKELIQKFKDAGLLEKHEIIEQTTTSGTGDLQTETTKKVMIITNATLEDYLVWCKNNFSYIKKFMNDKKIIGYVDNNFDTLQLETINYLYTSESVFEEFDNKFLDIPTKYGKNDVERNLSSDNYNSKNILTTSGFKGQCTWYSHGRALESTNKKVPAGNAYTWLSSAVAMGLDTGSYPMPNSIAVLAGRSYGHVAYVESYDGEKITISEGNVGNACSKKEANCSQVEYANQHANELVRTKTYSSLQAYKDASKSSGLYLVGFIYL